jgi:hypothetical protein
MMMLIDMLQTQQMEYVRDVYARELAADISSGMSKVLKSLAEVLHDRIVYEYELGTWNDDWMGCNVPAVDLREDIVVIKNCAKNLASDATVREFTEKSERHMQFAAITVVLEMVELLRHVEFLGYSVAAVGKWGANLDA